MATEDRIRLYVRDKSAAIDFPCTASHRRVWRDSLRELRATNCHQFRSIRTWASEASREVNPQSLAAAHTESYRGDDRRR